MVLKSVEISAFRNIEQARFETSPALNVIIGPNGSGKTSLLEAVHLGCLARSFRTGKTINVIRHGSDAAVVFVRMQEQGRDRRVGVRKARSGETEIRLDGTKATVADIARLMPVQVIAPGSQILIEGGPSYRRRFFDWGAFHVEHSFNEQWQRLVRATRQRNAALRSGVPARAVAAWDEALVESGEAVTAARMRFVKALSERIPELVEELTNGSFEVELRFRSGWKESETLAQALERSMDRDQEAGFTGIGPQRADVSILINGLPATEALSRGQQKLLVVALRLAQIEVVHTSSGRRCLVLVDDLPAELDEKHRRRVMTMLAKQDAQAFVTATDSALVAEAEWREQKVFHVEHGLLSLA
jgi:DNA replication and repair protein RecF